MGRNAATAALSALTLAVVATLGAAIFVTTHLTLAGDRFAGPTISGEARSVAQGSPDPPAVTGAAPSVPERR